MRVQQFSLYSQRINKRIGSRQAGVTSIEYALVASLIAMAIVVGAGSTGTALQTLWRNIASAVNVALGI